MENRVIKFRAWDGQNMRYQEPDLGFVRFFEMCSNDTLMQFTGLTDTKGKEIYEGDIILFNWNPILNMPSEIFTFELPVTYYTGWGCFVLHIMKKRLKGAQMKLFKENGLDECHVALGSPILHGDGVEVIGNIHENANLLEPQPVQK